MPTAAPPTPTKPTAGKLDAAAASIDAELDAALKALADALKKQRGQINIGAKSMNTTSKYWIPSGTMSPQEALVLAIPSPRKPSRDVYRDSLAQKFQQLIDQMPPREARDVMEMSAEYLPEMNQIAREQEMKWWGSSIAGSDTLDSLIGQVDWTLPGQMEDLPEEDLTSLLEQFP